MDSSNLLYGLFQVAEKTDASDIHLAPGEKPYLRIGSMLRDAQVDPLTGSAVQNIMEQHTMTAQGEGSTDADRRNGLMELYRKNGSVDYAFETDIEVAGGSKKVRYRINIYQTRGNMAAALRRIKLTIPTFEELHLPPIYETAINRRPKGIIIVGGETGSGKSTTLASMIDYINQKQARHIVTIEDPIEYVFHNNLSRIDQRELGEDFPAFSQALKYVVRQDPDVIMIGEIRDAETVETAIMAAETGHLVLTSLHTAGAVQTFYRILNFFTPDRKPSIRQNLASTLIAIMNQMLLPSIKEGVPVVPATEVLLNDAVVRGYIEKEDEASISEVLEKRHEGMHDFNNSLLDLVHTNLIDPRLALSASPNPDKLRTMLSMHHA